MKVILTDELRGLDNVESHRKLSLRGNKPARHVLGNDFVVSL